MRILDQHGKVLFDQLDDGAGRRPEALRGNLRRILLDSLPDQTVQWGRKVTGVRPLSESHHQLTFADGTTVTSALLVGADGVWSKVRPLLSDAKPRYTGTTFIETYLYDADQRHAATAEAVGAGAMHAMTPGAGIAAHREAGDVVAHLRLGRRDRLPATHPRRPRAATPRATARGDLSRRPHTGSPQRRRHQEMTMSRTLRPPPEKC